MEGDLWEDVPARVSRLRRSPFRSKVFGADGHGFTLHAPLTPAEVVQAEAQFGTALPAQYRSFLTAVGAGGAGPGYGLFPLARDRAGRWTWQDDRPDATDVGVLARDFAPGDFTAELRRLEQQMPPVAETDAYAAWLRAWDGLLETPGRTDGAAYVCHMGCGWEILLVVHGPDAGRIWSDDRGSDIDLQPLLARDGTPHTFATWYLSWLTEAEAAIGK